MHLQWKCSGIFGVDLCEITAELLLTGMALYNGNAVELLLTHLTLYHMGYDVGTLPLRFPTK